uniref:Protein ALP1-like isoform X1 n=1 Tax=Diabrotica virgifera virgifera TaxID=50390 RepID=A0A6P7GGM6_DIAVI
MGKLINANNINFPPPSLLGQGDTPFNFYIVGDEAFPLTTSIMRPYPGHFLPRDKRIFNYRLSRGRRVIENAFGILSSRWRIYRRTIIASESTVVAIVKATVCLHNFLINNGEKLGQEHKYIAASTVDHENEAGELVHGDWRSEHGNNVLPIGRMGSNMYAKNAQTMRQNLLRYFLNEGAIQFQENK